MSVGASLARARALASTARGHVARAPLHFFVAALALALAVLLSFAPSAEMSVRIEGRGSYQVFVDDGPGFTEGGSRWQLVEESTEVTVSGLRIGKGALRIDPPAGSTFRTCEPHRSVRWLPGIAVESRLQDRQVAGMRATRELDGCATWVVAADAPDPSLVFAFAPVAAEGGVAKLQRAARIVLWTIAFFGFYLGFGRLAVQDKEALARLSGRIYDVANAHLARIFLVMGVLLGLAFIVARPPGAVPDEFAHSSKIALMTAGQFVGVDHGKSRPALLADYGPFQKVYGEKFTFEQLGHTRSKPLSCTDVLPEGAAAPTVSSPLMYLAPWLSHELSCSLGASFGFYYYLAQLLNLAAYLLLAFIGIRAAVHGRWVLFLVATLPMSLYLATSVSYDSNMLGLCFAYLGITSGVYSGAVPVRRGQWWLLALGLAVALSKPLVGWIFLAPWICLLVLERSWKIRLKWLVLASLVPAALHAAWLLQVAGGGDANERPDVAAVIGMDALLAQPGTYIKAVLATAFSTAGDRIVQGVAGVFGWLDVYPPSSFYQLATCAAALALMLNARRKPASAIVFAHGIVVSLLAILVLCMPFYAFWTQPGSPVIEGLQGRYFLPIAALAGMACSFALPRSMRGLPALALLAMVPLLSIMAIQAIVGRYY